MDYTIFSAINGLAGQNSFLDQFGIFFAKYFLYIFLGIALLLLYRKDLRNNVYAGIVSLLISRGIIVEIIKRVIARPRPFETLDVHLLLVDEGTRRSFPSGHTVMLFSLAFAFWGTRWFWPFFALAMIGSLSRVFVGVHYPTDILASIVIAAAVVWAIRRLFKKAEIS